MGEESSQGQKKGLRKRTGNLRPRSKEATLPAEEGSQFLSPQTPGRVKSYLMEAKRKGHRTSPGITVAPREWKVLPGSKEHKEYYHNPLLKVNKEKRRAPLEEGLPGERAINLSQQCAKSTYFLPHHRWGSQWYKRDYWKKDCV